MFKKRGVIVVVTSSFKRKQMYESFPQYLNRKKEENLDSFFDRLSLDWRTNIPSLFLYAKDTSYVIIFFFFFRTNYLIITVDWIEFDITFMWSELEHALCWSFGQQERTNVIFVGKFSYVLFIEKYQIYICLPSQEIWSQYHFVESFSEYSAENLIR